MNAFVNHLGADYNQLHDMVKKAHHGDIKLHGIARVVRGNVLSRLICDVLGMPKASERVSLIVYGSHTQSEVIWRRNFDGTKMVSHFRQVGEYFVERMGPITLWLKLVTENGDLVYRLEKSEIFSIPMPGVFSPKLQARESEGNDKYVFFVKVSLPIIGTLIEYSGELDLEQVDNDL